MKTVLTLFAGTLLAVSVCNAGETADDKTEGHTIRSWAAAALLGQGAKSGARAGATFSTDFPVTFEIVTHEIDPSKLPFLELLQQDYGKPVLGKSVMGAPLRLGSTSYQHGLGTHSVSKIRVLLSKPASRFTADVGVNADSKRGTVVFAVEAGGKEVFRSGVCTAGGAPVSVSLDLHGGRDFTLRVLDAGDGPDSDWANWCNAKITYADSTSQQLDALPVYASHSGDCYVKIPSTRLLPQWTRTQTIDKSKGDVEQHNVTYIDPVSGLKVSCEIKLFKDFPAVEWVARLTNTGGQDSPILEKILPLDLQAGLPAEGKAVFHYNKCHDPAPAYYVYEPIDKTLGSNEGVTLPADLATPSQKFLPYFNLELPGGGVCGGIGWTGQWAVNIKREGRQVRLKIGQQLTHLRLHPGESIRTPRILLLSWQGNDRVHAQNQWRRLLLAHYVRRANGQVVTPLMSQTTFLMDEGMDCTEQTELEAIAKMPAMGMENYWMDAGWFGTGANWGVEAGNWFAKKDHFPRGLRPLGDAAHKAGLKFLLWIEPERVCAKSQVATEHPEWVLPKQAVSTGGLFNLGDPQARTWMTDLLSSRITEYGIDIYRQDRNLQPLGLWRANDTTDRQGITEIRHVEALYTMWDELVRRHPRLVIDNANWINTGPDLEVMVRSAGSWTCSENYTDWSRQQLHIGTLSMYVPLHATGLLHGADPYFVRSVARLGTVVAFDTRKFSAAQVEQVKRASDEVKRLRPLYLGDYYPLTPIDARDDNWCAWQFYRPDLGEGLAMFFRRPKCSSASLEVALHGLDASATYDVDFREAYDIRETKRMTGRELSSLHVDLKTRPASMLVHFRRVKNQVK